MPNPFSKIRKKRNSPDSERGGDDDFLAEGDIYALLGEDEQEENTHPEKSVKEKEAGDADFGSMDLGDVLESMTDFSKRDPKEREEGSEGLAVKDPFEGLSDAEKVAKAIELAQQEERSGRSRSGNSNKKKKAAAKRTGNRYGEKKRTGTSGKAKSGRKPVKPPKKNTRKSAAKRIRRSRRFVVLAAVAVCVIAFLIVWNVMERHTYQSYLVERQESRNDNVSSYEYVDGYILRYSTEGAALLDTDFRSIWNESFTMSRPNVSISGKQILLYDQRGTTVYVYNTTGRVSTFSTSLPILKAVISDSDTVAMLLQNGNSTQFSYCESDGSEIAGGQSSMSGTGYPVDLAVSPNGESLAVSYLRIRDDSVSTTLNFYNFGTAGQGKKNNLIGSDSLSDVIVPQIYYLSNRKMIAVRDDGFSVYEGISSVSEVNDTTFDRELVSSFHDDSNLAFCFSGDSENVKYQLQLYSGSGRELSSADLDMTYQRAVVCDDQIIFYGTSEIRIYNMHGFLKFSGKIDEGNLGSVLKVGRNRYLVVTDQTMEIIRLK